MKTENLKMAGSPLRVLERMSIALSKCTIQDINVRPKQVLCLQYLLDGYDVVAVLPTGFGKSLIFHLLPQFLPPRSKTEQSIVVVICPLNSIIEDQLGRLENEGISASVLRIKLDEDESLFLNDFEERSDDDVKFDKLPQTIREGKHSILFAHPEAIFSSVGRKLMKTDIYKRNVVACVIDEAHCVELW